MSIPYWAEPYTIAAGERVSFNTPGKSFRFISATGDLHVAFDNDDAYLFPSGLGLSPDGGFKKFAVENQTGAAITFRAAVSNGLIWDNRLEISSSAILPVSEAARSTLTGSGIVARTTAGHDTIAANAARKVITVSADPANTGVLTLRDSAGAVFGWLQPGQSWSEHTAAAVQVRNDSGATQSYAYAEVN